MHVPAIFHGPLAAPFWLVFLLAFGRESRVLKGAVRDDDAAQDRGTFRLLVVGSSIAMLLGFALALLPVALIEHETAAVWIGMALIVAGAWLRRACFNALGASFTGVVHVKPGQVVVDRGPYRFVRHPSYTAAWLMFLGLGLALGSWLATAMLFAAHVALYDRRATVEEEALLAVLGQRYRDYRARTKKYIPFVW